jgi:hypothetical protein
MRCGRVKPLTSFRKAQVSLLSFQKGPKWTAMFFKQGVPIG